MPYTYENADGRRGIDSKVTFIAALNGQAVLSLDTFETVFKTAEDLIRNEYPAVSKGAISNVRGNWYEWLLALGTIEFKNKTPDAHYLLPLPNIRQFDCAKLYSEEIYSYIHDLRIKVKSSSDASLITSNPDFVIVDKGLDVHLPDIVQNELTPQLIEDIDRVYVQLEHKCLLDQLIGYAAAKSSLRPDRRLQIAHEGSLMKALYRHVQTREWLIDARGIKYFAITSTATDADRNALKTIATHSIVDVSSKPEAAVDGLFCVFSGQELETALKVMLT